MNRIISNEDHWPGNATNIAGAVNKDVAAHTDKHSIILINHNNKGIIS